MVRYTLDQRIFLYDTYVKYGSAAKCWQKCWCKLFLIGNYFQTLSAIRELCRLFTSFVEACSMSHVNVDLFPVYYCHFKVSHWLISEFSWRHWGIGFWFLLKTMVCEPFIRFIVMWPLDQSAGCGYPRIISFRSWKASIQVSCILEMQNYELMLERIGLCWGPVEPTWCQRKCFHLSYEWLSWLNNSCIVSMEGGNTLIYVLVRLVQQLMAGYRTVGVLGSNVSDISWFLSVDPVKCWDSSSINCLALDTCGNQNNAVYNVG
jgi:hypothetical protein